MYVWHKVTAVFLLVSKCVSKLIVNLSADVSLLANYSGQFA